GAAMSALGQKRTCAGRCPLGANFSRELPLVRTLPVVYERIAHRTCDCPRNELAAYGVGCWLSKRLDFDTRSTQTRTRILNGAWHGKSIYDGPIHRGCKAPGACRHCDARGDGRTGGADCRRGG